VSDSQHVTDESAVPAAPVEPAIHGEPALDVQSASVVESAPVVEPAPYGEPATAPERRTRGKGLRVTLGVALAFVVVTGGGLGWLAFGHTDAKPRPWTAPSVKHGSYGALSGGIHYGKLSKLLLPMPADWSAGPDIEQFGDNTQLSSAQATTVFKSQYGDLSNAQRKQLTKAVGKLGIKGLGLRSYQNDDDDKVVQIQLLQIDKQYAKASTEAMTRLLNAVMSKGPKVPGHSEAHCYQESLVKKGAIQEVDCLADEGDLMVTFTVQGTKPAGDQDVLTLLKDQLDRIADPGESV
jgi:hypothetical protein